MYPAEQCVGWECFEMNWEILEEWPHRGSDNWMR